MSGPTSSTSSLLDDDQQLTRRISNGDDIDCTTKLTCTITTNDGFRRKKSASLNSPANPGKRSEYRPRDEAQVGFFFVDNRPTAEELEKLELPWSWRSYSVSWMKGGCAALSSDLCSLSVTVVDTDSFFKVKDLVMSNDLIRTDQRTHPVFE